MRTRHHPSASKLGPAPLDDAPTLPEWMRTPPHARRRRPYDDELDLRALCAADGLHIRKAPPPRKRRSSQPS